MISCVILVSVAWLCSSAFAGCGRLVVQPEKVREPMKCEWCGKDLSLGAKKCECRCATHHPRSECMPENHAPGFYPPENCNAGRLVVQPGKVAYTCPVCGSLLPRDPKVERCVRDCTECCCVEDWLRYTALNGFRSVQCEYQCWDSPRRAPWQQKTCDIQWMPSPRSACCHTYQWDCEKAPAWDPENDFFPPVRFKLVNP